MTGFSIAMEMILFLVVLALLYDFMNRFHDAAHSTATVVSTSVLKSQYAAAWAAFFNVIAIFVVQLTVAATACKGTIDPVFVDHFVILGAQIASGLMKTLLLNFVSPLLGFVFGTPLMLLVTWILRLTAPRRVVGRDTSFEVLNRIGQRQAIS
jgi:PiT family inorganic phosphate transporter